MASSINSNISAYFAQGNLSAASLSTNSSISRLSSGERIVRAADDVAGLSVGTVLRTAVNTLRTALSNTNQANALLQLADGGLANVGDLLQRQKALAVQATAGTLSSAERGFLNQEFQALAGEIDRLSANTKFNQVTLLNGSLYDDAFIETITGTIANTETTANASPLAFTGTVAYLDSGVSAAEFGTILDAIDPTNAGTGIDLANIADNAAFVGKLTNKFKVTFNAQNNLTLSIQVGDILYTGSTNAANNAGTDITMTGVDVRTGQTEGGTFELSLGAGAAAFTNIDDQVEANLFGKMLDDSFSKVTFYQNRQMVEDAVGLMSGGSAVVMSSDFDNLRVTDIRIKIADGTNTGDIEIDVGGRTLRAAGAIAADGSIAAGGVDFVDTNLAAALQVDRIRITFPAVAAGTLDNEAGAADLVRDLKAFFRVGTGNTALNFQTGQSVGDKIEVQIRSVSTSKLYDGKKLDILSVANAQAAGSQIDKALNYVTSVRADVGALQSRFDYAAANLQTSIQNTDAARGEYLDADISEESTKFASNQVLMQASISVLAQANLLPQNLLKLIG
jgi:flagellin